MHLSAPQTLYISIIIPSFQEISMLSCIQMASVFCMISYTDAGTGIVYILGSASAILLFVAYLVPYYKLYANYTVIQERQACFCFNDPTNGDTTCEGNCDERGQRFDRQTRTRTRTRTNVRTRRQEPRTRTHRQDDDHTGTRHTGAARACDHRQESPRHIDGRTRGRRQESSRHIDGRSRGRRQEQYTQNRVLRRAICQDAQPKKRYAKCQVPRRKREEGQGELLNLIYPIPVPFLL